MGHRELAFLLAAGTGFPAVAAPDPAPASFFVAPFGSDDADGSALYPFATLDRARLAMQAGPTRTTMVHGGTYALRATLVLGAADCGVAFVAVSGSAPVLDGRRILPSLIELDGARNVTLKGLTFQNAAGDGAGAVQVTGGFGNALVANTFHDNANGIVLAGSDGNLVLNNALNRSDQSAVEVKDGSNGNTFASNSIDGTGALAESGGGFFLHGASGNTVTHNLVQNTAGIGIGIANWDDSTVNRDNAVTYNVLRNTSTRSQDSGAIYVLGRSHVDTGLVIAGNLVDGTGASGDAHTIGIYLDDSTSGATVRDNLVRNIGTHAVEIHGGDRNAITNNIFDLGGTATSAVLFQAAPADTNPTNTMLDNTVTRNVLLATGAGQTAYTSLDGGAPRIGGNLYDGFTPDQAAAGVGADTAPVFAPAGFADPAAGDYTPLPGSATASIGFTPVSTAQVGVEPLPADWAR